MVLSLAFRNTRLYFWKRLPMALFLALTMGLLFLGNTILSGTEAGLSRTFRASLTGDLSISSQAEDAFTLFGSELPLLGEFFKMPLIGQYQDVAATVKATVPEAETLSVVVGLAKIRFAEYKGSAALFAVDLNAYFQFFPALKLVKGSLSGSDQPSILVNDKQFAAMTKRLGYEPSVGDMILLASPQEGSFALREVKLAGVFSYPVYDPVLENVSLIDVGTGRALAGYFITSSEPTQGEAVSTESVDDLFADATDTKAPTNEGISFGDVTADLNKQTDGPVADPQTWNFLLIRTPHPEVAMTRLSAALAGAAIPLQVRDWRETAGGNAKILGFIQLLFNLGLVFVSVVAGLIVMNSMALSVAERTREIGTMRSLGAQKPWLASLVASESLVLVVGGALFGLLGAVGLLLGVQVAGGVPIGNPFLAGLLGTDLYRPSISWWLVSEHIGLAIVLGLLATALPIYRAMQVNPLQAMVRE